MSNAKRIGKELLSDELRIELESKLSGDTIIDWDQIINKPQISDSSWKPPVQTPADLPLVGNEDGDIRLTLDEEKYVFTWDEGYQQWMLIGTNDVNINWEHIQGKPSSYPPSTHRHGWSEIDGKPSTYTPSSHTHNESDIIDLDKYTKLEVDTRLDTKANASHAHSISEVTGLVDALNTKVDNVVGKSLSENDFTNADKLKLDSLSENASVEYETMYNAHNTHVGDTTIHVTQADKNTLATVDGKAEKSYVDTQLSGKANSSTLTGHIENVSIHVTQADKDKLANIDSKASGITLVDTNNFYTSSNVEGALEEIGLAFAGVRGNLITSVNEILGG